MSNQYFLKDGRNFTVNTDIEANPSDARSVKKQFLMGLNLLDVEKDKVWTVEAIRALSVGLVAQMKDGKRLTKKELLEELRAFQEEERKSKSSILDAMLEDGVTSVELLDQVFAAISNNMTPSEVGELIRGTLALTYTTDVSLVKTGINRLYRALAHDERFVSYQSAVIKVKQYLSETVTKQVSKEYRADYEKGVEDSQENQRTIKLEPILKFTRAILESPEQYNYVAVAFAIAFATGRRMAEIMGDHSTWKETGEYAIDFTGLLKTKSLNRIGEHVTLLTIVPAYLVINGIKYLDDEGVRIDHNRVNARYSKQFSTRTPPPVQEVKRASGIETFKDTRDFYAAYHTQTTHNQAEHGALNIYLKNKVMHHDDLITSQTYQKMLIV